jgi:hypothetical protein
MKEIRKIIREELGVQMEIKQAARRIAELTIHHYIQNRPVVPEYYDADLGFLYRTENQKIIDATQVEAVHIQPYIAEQKEPRPNDKKITGSFKTSKTTINNNNLFQVVIDIVFRLTSEEYDRLTDFLPHIENVVSHELNHAFVHVKKYHKPSKSKIHHTINKKMQFSDFNEIPALKEFMDMFYLNLPEEIQARVQETGSLLSHIDKQPYKETVKELYRFPPINDAKRMLNYTDDNLRWLPKKVLNAFVEKFNKEADFRKGALQFKRIDDHEKFFAYWIQKINYGGIKLNNKILKLVGDHFNLNEIERANKPFDTGVWYEIFED